MDKALGGGSVTLYVFFLLLPGLLGSIVYDYLLEGEKRDNTDRIASALILALLSSVILHFLFGIPILPNMEITNETSIDRIINTFLAKNLLYASVVSSVLALVFAALNNHGTIYAILQFFRITYKTGDADVWRDVFYKTRGCWISIGFQDGRRLVGWPKYFSSTGKPREIFVADATWYHPDEAGELIATNVSGPGVYVSNFDDVVAIELLQ